MNTSPEASSGSQRTAGSVPPTKRSLLLTAVALTALSSLLVELALTRLFSVLLYYHFAFMAISVALLGLGAGGLSSYWLFGDRPLDRLWNRLGWLAAANAAALTAMLAVVLQMQVGTEVSLQTAVPLTVIYFVCAIPFFLSGAILAVVLARTVRDAGLVYFADLAGAGAGALLLVPALNTLGGPNTILLAAAVSAASAVLWRFQAGSGWRRWMLGPAIVLVLIMGNLRWPLLDVRSAKGVELSTEIFSKWNSFSRVGLSKEPSGYWIRIDGDAATPVATTPVEDDTFWRAERSQFGSGLVHTLRAGSRTLIIGPGGGYDVARALSAGSQPVTRVEINPIIVRDIMLGIAREASHGLYRRPEVSMVVEDGRSYIRRSPERFGAIQATLVDTWASTAAGAFALTENNLYTVDAFREYLRHLEPDGILSITRWEFARPREALRLVSLGMEALRREQATRPADHFVVVSDGAPSQGGAPTTMLLKRSPFSAAELEQVRVVLRGARYLTPLYLPNQATGTPFEELLRAPDARAYQEAYPFDITPVDDNRPFFFFNVRARDLPAYFSNSAAMDFKVNLGLFMLLALLAISGAGVLVFLFLPACLSTRLPRAPGVTRWLLYFCAIGLAFILVEIAFIQKFVLFLGHPTYALTVAVFLMLAASGCGSYWTRRLPDENLHARLAGLLLGAAALLAVLAAIVTPVLTSLVGLPLAGRILVAAIMLAPAGFLMGTAFPTGMRLAARVHPDCLQWAWAMNAAASVLGSLLAVLVSIHLGIWQTLALGAMCYVVAGLLARRTGPGIAVAKG